MLMNVRRCAAASVLMLALTLTACGSGESEEAAEPANPAATSTVATDDGDTEAAGAGDTLALGERAEVDYVEFENLGDVALTRHLIEPTVEDTDGQEYRAMTLVVLSGTFKPCPESSDKKLGPGERFTGCSAILLPKGKELERVRFEGDVTKDPVFWSPA